MSNRAKRGLYHQRDVRFGNNISFSENKTRRSWKPNAQHKRFWSRILQCWLRFNVTTRAMRSIDKAGGIDEYVLFTPNAKLDSVAGRNAKRMLLAKLEERGDQKMLHEVSLVGEKGQKMRSVPALLKWWNVPPLKPPKDGADPKPPAPLVPPPRPPPPRRNR
mmetsp:Transcript_4366/g.13635  ORF Transcript_4366/g.13635 Transcript_4366/m.13635 type:complete len:162 (+) Transcript_4366:367-852(+)